MKVLNVTEVPPTEPGSEVAKEGPKREVSPLDDKTILDEINIIFSEVHADVVGKTESDDIKEILGLLGEISINLRKYQKNTKDKTCLDEALNAARKAKIKMTTISTMSKSTWKRGSMQSSLTGGIVLLFFGWVVLHAIFGWVFSQGLFYLDAFFVSFLGAITSSILYLGRNVTERIDTLKTFGNLAASPFVAVVLVVLLSQLAIGVGGETSSGVVPSNIVTFTLKDASIELKMAFAFMFGFFGELSVELLKRLFERTAD